MMKLQNLRCPNCTGKLDINIDGKDYIFCPYCGDQFYVGGERLEYTINKNININKTSREIWRFFLCLKHATGMFLNGKG